MDIKVVSTDEGFYSLRDDWIRLMVMNSELSVFQSWEWQSLWWKYYGQNKTLKVIVAYDDDKIIGILPLYIQKQKLFKYININVMRFVGTGGDTSPDYLGVLSQSQYTESFCNHVSHYILSMKKQWDVIFMSDIADNNIFIKILNNTLKRECFKYEIKTHATIQYVDLPESWSCYVSSRSKKQRKSFRYTRNSFEKLDKFKFYIWKDKKNINKIIDKLIELHHMRWQGREKQYSFTSTNYINFHRDVIAELYNYDAIRLYCMEVNSKVMAIEYCYRWNKSIYNFQGGFDTFYEKNSPGKAIFTYMIESAINEGNKIFDMLKGDYSYKKSLSNNERETSSITIYQKNILGGCIGLDINTFQI